MSLLMRDLVWKGAKDGYPVAAVQHVWSKHLMGWWYHWCCIYVYMFVLWLYYNSLYNTVVIPCMFIYVPRVFCLSKPPSAVAWEQFIYVHTPKIWRLLVMY